MSVTVVKGLLQRLDAESARKLTNPSEPNNQIQTSRNAATAVSSGDAVVTTLRASFKPIERYEKPKPIKNDGEAKEVADNVAANVRNDDEESTLGAHSVSDSSHSSLD